MSQHHVPEEWNLEVHGSDIHCVCVYSKLISVLNTICSLCSPNLVLLSIVTATLKIVESLPHFLSPYLDKLLHEVSIQSAKWQHVSDDSKVTPVVHKLKAIR